MNKLQQNNIDIVSVLKFILKIIIFILVAYLPLKDLSIHHYSIWTDFNGSFNLINDPLKYFQSVSENNFGRSFGNPSTSLYLIYLKALYSLFNIRLSTFLAFYINTLSSLVLIFLLIKETIGKKSTFILNLCISLIFIYSPIYIYHAIGVATLTYIIAINGLILSLLLYEKYRKLKNDLFLFLIPIASCFIIHPFVFVFYFFILSYLFIIDKNFKSWFFVCVLLFFTNLYWIGPFVFSTFHNSGNTVINDTTNILILINSTYAKLIKSFIFSPRDSAENILPLNLGDYIKPIIILYLSLWMISVIGLIKYRNSRNILVFILLLITIVFSIGPSITPLGAIFNYLLSNLVIFGFFRSFMNINLINLILLLYFFCSVMKVSVESKTLKIYFIICVIILSCSTLKRFDDQFGPPRLIIPSEYLTLQKKINSQKNDFYILYVPFSRGALYNWAYKNIGLSFIYDFFNRGLIFNYEGEDYNLRKEGQIYDTVLNNSDFAKLLGQNSIEYIIFDKSLLNETTESAAASSKIKRKLNKSTTLGLIKVDSNQYFDIYKIQDGFFYPKIISKNIKFLKINPSEYQINITLQDKSLLSFNSNYDNNWELFLQETNLFKCNNIAFFKKEDNLTECFNSFTSKLSSIDELKYLFKNSDFKNVGNKEKQNLINSWLIEKAKLKNLIDNTRLKNEGYPKKRADNSLDWKYFIENPDGSITISLLLYYKSQALFLLTYLIFGFIVILLLFIILFKLIFSFLLQRNQTKINHYER